MEAKPDGKQFLKAPDYEVTCSCSEEETIEETKKDHGMKVRKNHKCSICGSEGEIVFDFRGDVDVVKEERSLEYRKH